MVEYPLHLSLIIKTNLERKVAQMGVEGLLALVVIILGALISASIVIPKLARMRFIFEGGRAFAESLAASRAATDDTPGVITPQEWAEAFEAGAAAAGNALRNNT